MVPAVHRERQVRTMEHQQLSIEEARELAEHCLLANGCDQENAEPVAASMIAAERDICLSHGLFRLPGYVASLRSGKINGRARPRLETPAPAVLLVDGDHAMAPVAHAAAFGPFAERVHQQGVACLAIQRVHHFSALWVELEALAGAGLAAFACTSYTPVVAPFGAGETLFGTNPFAFGWPRPDGQPMIFDMATAAMARGEIMIAEREGHEVPPGTGVDREGKPSVDPAAILAGAQLAFGGYKGSALALMVELLAGPLIGETLSFETKAADNADGGPPSGGEFLLAMDPERIGGSGWAIHAEQLFARIEAMEGARLPAGRRYANREQTAVEGIRLPVKLYAEITALAKAGREA